MYSPQLNSKNVQARIQEYGDEFGNKAANLIELNLLCSSISSEKVKVQIPEINPINHSDIQAHLDHYAPQWNDLWQSFVNIQGRLTTLHSQAKNYLTELQNLIKDTFIKHPIENNLANFLNVLHLKNADLMVRSTGKEDDVNAANPGGNTSVAAVKPDVKSISQAIGIVVASYFSEKSLKQRLLSPPPANDITQKPFMPVLLQRMIGEPVQYLENEENKSKGQAKNEEKTIVCSGVMYANEGKITIQIAPGHGELIVNSKAPFDTFFVSRGDVVYPTIYQKKYRLAPTEENHERKLTLIENQIEIQNSPSISSTKALEIAKLGREIEEYYNMAMDIEFVYDPSQDIIYVVQARPIPIGDRGLLKPSSFSPDRIPELKTDKSISIEKASVISPADHAAKVITKKAELLICENIEMALNYYLAQKNSPIKTVIVKNMAPSTSHEAAQFNAKAIPVLQCENIDQISEWMKKPKAVIIIDPQRNQLVDWTNKVKDYAKVEDELYQDNILAHGRFRSPLPPMVTLSPAVSFEEKIQPKFKSAFGKELEKNPYKNILFAEKPYTELENLLEILEAAKPGERNEAAIEALLGIQFYLYRLSSLKENDQLFQQAIVFCADAKNCLDSYTQLNRHSIDIEKAREEWLELVSKLSALIVNRGNASLFSDSIYQRAQNIKENKYAWQYIPKKTGLNKRQFSYFNEFLKLNKIILNPEIKNKWNKFVGECCINNEYSKRLAQLIKFMMTNDIQSDVLNIIFPECVKANLNAKNILIKMGKECAETKEHLDAIKLDQIKVSIQGWISRCSGWSNPNQFDQLFKEYNKEIYELIDKLSIEENTIPLVKKAILKTVQDLADMMDITIKAMKGSPEYQIEDEQRLQVLRFVMLLEPYYALMKKFMMKIDDAQFMEWENNVRFSFIRMDKHKIMEKIQKRFDKLKKSNDVNQLNSSGKFSVDSARIGSAASFWFQFVRKKTTLEDLFSLFHQNILASTTFLGKETQIKEELLPKEIQPIIHEFSRPEGNRHIDLLSVEHHYPIVRLEYNLPLRNHAAKFVFDYNQENQVFHLKVNFFGNNIGNYMSKSCALAFNEGLLLEALGIQTKQSPIYNKSSFNLEFIWEWKASEIENLIPILKKAFLKYGQIPFGNEDTKTLFSYLDDKTRYGILLEGAECLLKNMQTTNNINPEKAQLLSIIIEQIQQLTINPSPEEYLRISNLFLNQLAVYTNNINKNLTSNKIQYLNQLMKRAIEYAQKACNTSDRTIIQAADTQINKVLAIDTEIKRNFETFNTEAKDLVEDIKYKISATGTKIIKFPGGKEIALNYKSLRKAKYSEKHLHQIHLAERGEKSYIDTLNSIAKNLLTAAEVNCYFSAQEEGSQHIKNKRIQDVLQFTFLNDPPQAPNEIIKGIMEEYLHRRLAKLKNKSKHTDNLAKILIEMVDNDHDYKDILHYAVREYIKNGGNKEGDRKFAHILNFLNSMYMTSYTKEVEFDQSPMNTQLDRETYKKSQKSHSNLSPLKNKKENKIKSTMRLFGLSSKRCNPTTKSLEEDKKQFVNIYRHN